MIKSLKVTNHLGESIVIELENPEKSGFLIDSITGLGPGKATINTTEQSSMDGVRLNSSRLGCRNIVISLKFDYNPTIEYMRQLSYKFFPLKKKIKLTIETTNRMCDIYGVVESNEPDIFSSQEGTLISLLCPDPYFYSTNDLNVSVFAGIESTFEFPFFNDSITSNEMMVGEIILNQSRNIIYDGDSEIGITIYIHSLGSVGDITIYNVSKRETMYIDSLKIQQLTGSGIIIGDDIIISTKKGEKSITLLRDGEVINILNCLDRNSAWFQLNKGDNIFAFTATNGSTNLQFRIENYIIYEGV